MCHMLGVTCHMLCVTCPVPCVTCFVLTFTCHQRQQPQQETLPLLTLLLCTVCQKIIKKSFNTKMSRGRPILAIRSSLQSTGKWGFCNTQTFTKTIHKHHNLKRESTQWGLFSENFNCSTLTKTMVPLTSKLQCPRFRL